MFKQTKMTHASRTMITSRIELGLKTYFNGG